MNYQIANRQIKYIVLFFFLLIFMSCMNQDEEMFFVRSKMAEIEIRDNHFEVIRVLEDEESLDYFYSFLTDIETSGVPDNLHWDCKIDLTSSDRRNNGRWLYDKRGYLARLNYRLKPCFKVNNYEELNVFIFGD